MRIARLPLHRPDGGAHGAGGRILLRSPRIFRGAHRRGTLRNPRRRIRTGSRANGRLRMPRFVPHMELSLLRRPAFAANPPLYGRAVRQRAAGPVHGALPAPVACGRMPLSGPRTGAAPACGRTPRTLHSRSPALRNRSESSSRIGLKPIGRDAARIPPHRVLTDNGKS